MELEPPKAASAAEPRASDGGPASAARLLDKARLARRIIPAKRVCLWSEPSAVTNHYSGPADRLIGRSSELAAVGAFLDQARSDGAALLIFGEPGAGKTALLDAAAEMALAAGTRVLRAAGAEFEAEMSFAGVHQSRSGAPGGAERGPGFRHGPGAGPDAGVQRGAHGAPQGGRSAPGAGGGR